MREEKKIARILAGVAFCSLCLTVLADPGTVVQTNVVQGPVVKTTLTWASGTNNYASGDSSYYVRGTVQRVEIVPNLASFPSNAYDVTLSDENGVDILAGLGADASSNTVSCFCPGLVCTDGGATTSMVPFVVNDIFSLLVTNCGNSRGGSVVLYLK